MVYTGPMTNSSLHKAIDDSNLSVNDKIAIRLELGAIEMIRTAYIRKYNIILGGDADITLDDVDISVVGIINSIPTR